MDKFATRLNRKDGESLSGYLMRAAKANFIEKIGLILSYIRTSGGLRERCNHHSLDTLSGKHVNVDALSKITGLSYEEILPMTMVPIYRKFVRKEEILEIPEPFLLKQVLETAHRRYCPDCLRQNGTYKLIWQIKDIELCNIHHVPLTSKCPKCGAEQPYITDQLGAFKCYECNALLFEESKQHQTGEFEHLRYQQYLFQQWEYLLDIKSEGLIPTPKMSYEKQMACTLLFLLLDKSSQSNMRFRFLSMGQRKEIYGFIKNKLTHEYAGAFVSPKKLIKYMYKLDMSVEQFFNTTIPDEFVVKLTRFLKTDESVLANTEKVITKKRYSPIRHEKAVEILKAVDDFLIQKQPLEKLTVRKVLKSLSLNNSRFPPEVNQYIRRKVNEYNQKYWDALVGKVRDATIDLINQSELPSYQKVADKIGFHVSNIKRNPALIDAIKSARENS